MVEGATAQSGQGNHRGSIMSKETTNWDRESGPAKLSSSTSSKSALDDSPVGSNKLVTAGMAALAGLIIAALARGVKKSDYYKEDGEKTGE